MKSRLMLVHALSPLHAGIGQGVGAIDLPIARDVATNRPLLPGSSLKGAMRDVHENLERPRHKLLPLTHKVFGPPTEASMDHGGAAQFGDARLLLLPVRSLVGTFAWVTCPDVLAAFARDAEMAGVTLPATWPMPSDEQHCHVVTANPQTKQDCGIFIKEAQAEMVYLEDLDLIGQRDAQVDDWAVAIGKHLFPQQAWWQNQFAARFCVAHDNVFNFLSETATEVRARVVLNDGKTVDNLWYEESLPAESVLAALVHADPPRKTGLSDDDVFQAIGSVTDAPLQLGGKATVGRGLCRTRLLAGQAPLLANQGGEANAAHP